LSLLLTIILASKFLDVEKYGSSGIFIAVPLIALCSIIVGIFVSVKFVPIVAEKFANALLFQGSEDYKPGNQLEMAKCLMVQKRYEEASDCFDEAIEYEWMNQKTWSEIVDFHIEKREDPIKALEVLNKALDNPNWQVTEHITLLKQLAFLHYNDLDSKPAAEGIYQFVEDKYGEIPYAKTILAGELAAFKPAIG